MNWFGKWIAPFNLRALGLKCQFEESLLAEFPAELRAHALVNNRGRFPWQGAAMKTNEARS